VGLGVEYIIKNALLRRTLDNVTVVIIAFDGFYNECLKLGMQRDQGEGEMLSKS
jgi:hypothetical protein